MGSSTSGNFGHAGRPGERGGSSLEGGHPHDPIVWSSRHGLKHQKTAFAVEGEKMPNRKVMGSSIGPTKLEQHTEFDKPVHVEVTGSGGYRKRTAEDVVAIDLPKKQGDDIIFHRRYPGGRVIQSPYKSEKVTRIRIRTSHSNPDRNYFLS